MQGCQCHVDIYTWFYLSAQFAFYLRLSLSGTIPLLSFFKGNLIKIMTSSASPVCLHFQGHRNPYEPVHEIMVLIT